MRSRWVVAAILIAITTPAVAARTYLASMRGILLNRDESISGFTLKTWGVEIKTVCRIPADWEITAGRFGPGGRITGQAGHGASELRTGDLGDLRGLALVELSHPVARKSHGAVPATFGGSVNIPVGRNSSTRTMALTFANVSLVETDRCPSR